MNVQQNYGPWALIAGASEGLGAAWAHAAAARGLKLVLLARRQTALDDVAQTVRQRFNVDVATLAVDLSSPALLETIEPTLKGKEIGLYVHNAAFVPQGAFLSRTLDDQRMSLAVNCRAPLELAHVLGAQMAKRGRGGIVLMSSLTAFQGTPLLATYGATKAFNLTLAEALHTELAPSGVDVLACCAGATRTPGYLRSSPQGAPGELEPAEVVEEAFAQLGRRPFVIPGAFNRFAAFFMRRVLPRAITVRMLENEARKLRLPP